MSDTDALAVRGIIFDIQRFCIHDGPGIRTTVFLKGCPLRCAWCHNPEGVAPQPGLSFEPEKCIGCGYCLRVCPEAAHVLEDGRHILNRDLCAACGVCTEECYAGALERVGREVNVEEALATVLRDTPFYETSGGGMTVSGGEPLLQIEFTEALLTAAKDAGLHCCVETCGHADFSLLERILDSVDLFLYDVKDTDNQRHLDYTGVPNTQIIGNLRALVDRGAAVRLRLPIVPGLNDRPDHFQGVAELVSDLPGLLGVELMPYHRLGLGKLDRLGLKRQVPEPPAPDEALVDSWIGNLRKLGIEVLNGRPGTPDAGP
ncbi:MAG: glycyl-radical enzyme activating protein [Planctomycetota bacterium]|jgi:pyruvate formate lyase activating enzyme